MIYINKIMELLTDQQYPILEDGLDRVSFGIIVNNEYSWWVSRKYFPFYTYPLRTKDIILTFKTLNGAKRNFIRWIRQYHSELIYENPLQRLKRRYETKV